ncbi:oligopeptidase family protein [Ophiostoma piceae UAMH 11346]|uniref:Dipeptidyl-peptidase V n=1 Tax=Ophiostoma piceae (strain UAMH 11346) TaxID=1262450 RepID=S3C869_OPHP1|nr:oligopeptidase family protein [Ophiostoma piceae UAMH 11346]
MVLCQKLTPETLVSAPHRSPAVPSPSGRVAFFTVSTHELSDDATKTKGKTTRELFLMDLSKGDYWLFTAAGTPDDVAKIGNIAWVPGSDDLLWLKSAKNGEDDTTTTQVVVAAATYSPEARSTAHVVAFVPAAISGLRLKALPDGNIAFAVAGLVARDGSLYGGPPMPETANGSSSARIYDTWQVREWDAYLKPQPYSIWYSSLRYEGEGWHLGELFNALANSPLEAPCNMYEPSDPASAYDIGAQGLVFVARAPVLTDPALACCTDVYYVPLDSFTGPTAYKPTKIRITASPSSAAPSTSDITGECSNPRFSPDGTMIAFLRSPLACPADMRLHMGHIVSGAAYDVVSTIVGPSAALPSPDAFEFAAAGGTVLVDAHDCGRRSLFVLDIKQGARARCFSAKQGSLVDFHVIKKNGPADRLSSYSVLLTGSSFVESSYYHMIDLDEDAVYEPRVVSTATKDGSKYGLCYEEQVAEMYFEGAGEYCVQAWVVRPRTSRGTGSDETDATDTAKKPIALFIHGGPESAFNDEWHARWNAAVWAEQGYIVVMPNFSGSRGFGVEHQSRIYNSWGGAPYDDLVKVMDGLKKVPDIDCDRAVVCGASYGGYMVNWILGSPLAKSFRAAVSHDSVFSTAGMGLNCDVSLGTAAFGGPLLPWSNLENVERWNPARPDRLALWRDYAPPTLVVNSDLDFRCPFTDGLSVFRALQFQGVPSRFLMFPDENHMVRKPENLVVWMRVMLEWTDRWREVPRVV